MASSDDIGGHWRLAFEHNYIGVADLKGKDVTLTISKIVRPELEMVKDGKRQKQRKLVFHFTELANRPEGQPRMLVCNRTNAATIAGLYGDVMDHWVGKRITLFPDMTVKAFGRPGGVRVREKIPAGKQQQARGGPSTPPTEEPPPPAAGPEGER
jgi:hypothetical protein